MTLIMGAVSPDGASVCIGGDSKVWWKEDEARSRKIFAEPVLKIVLLNEDLVVGYAGSGPEMLAASVVSLRGLDLPEVLDKLCEIDGAAFLVAQRLPAKIWRVEDGQWGDVTNSGVSMIGDDYEIEPGLSLFTRAKQMFEHDFPDCEVAFRLESTLQNIVFLRQPETVGGFVVLAGASDSVSFRYSAMPVTRFSPIFDGVISEPPLQLQVLVGSANTPGALAYFVRNANLGHLFCHEQPQTRHQLQCSSTAELAQIARKTHGQELTTPLAIGGC